ncbi:MAG: hypothetical protein WBI34_00495 [Tenuifilaceae bacterium]|jgi:hypothetical protein|nr:hypothetical protein [Bacteroidales bacterium]MDI9516072.1 hypothetical protein [Bacteroidota bacterium]NLH56019.1 hypothetical protein [Rikenellaceae bacterium]OQC62292.1 MAG: hypothetical protein BWX49_01807 [Bacteroidetes bacterium ADurb.Bin008]HNV81642.1 hypothetical protein [Tenuifilaceae bacterium]
MKKLIFILISAAIFFSGCKKSEEEDKYNPSTDGLIGSWLSKGDNVAELLRVYFQVDSITAVFHENNTYNVVSYSGGTPTNYNGTFVQTKPTSGTIWTIKLLQSAPTSVTSEGIFEITGKTPNFLLTYEVVQTEPNIGATPPTPEAGFGSSNGGLLAMMNVQKFVYVPK